MTILPAATAPFDWADLLDLDDADLRALRAEAAVDLGPELDPDPLPALRDWAAPLLTATAAELGEIEGDRLDLLDWRVVDRFVSGRRERRRERESRERYDQRRRKRLAAKAERERAEAAKSPEQRAAEQAERERHAAADAERAAKLQAAREARWADPILAAQLPSTYIAMVGKAGHERMLRLGRDRLAAGIEHERYSAPVVVRRRSLAGIVREGRGELRQLAGQLDAIERLSEGACWKSIAAMRADLDAARARLRVIARRVRARRRDHDAAMLAMIANAYRIDLADAARPDYAPSAAALAAADALLDDLGGELARGARLRRRRGHEWREPAPDVLQPLIDFEAEHGRWPTERELGHGLPTRWAIRTQYDRFSIALDAAAERKARRSCAYCGTSLDGRRAGAKWCRDACRKAAGRGARCPG